MEKWLKVVKKLWKKDEVLAVIESIMTGDFSDLNIKQLAGKPWYYRCRIWKIRIIFFEKDGRFFVDKVGYRGDIYKNI